MANEIQLDAFEVAKEIEKEEYKSKLKTLENAKLACQNRDTNRYDCGLSEVEDRNEIRAINKEIEELEDEHIEKMKSLQIPTKDSR